MADTKVPGLTQDNAILLLAAAEELELDKGVVRTSSEGYFTVPQEVADKAGLGKTEQRPKKRRTARSATGKEED